MRPLAARRRELNVLLERQKKEQGEANARIRELMKTDKAAGEKARAEPAAARRRRQGERGGARRGGGRDRRGCCCSSPTRRTPVGARRERTRRTTSR
ncbi:MAG: hypothetical protein M0C28_40755 [Candidatus Moduliflexus flocculans]|nr:hypothetical protein [Candidatus Moduliflexus flocculans]